MEMKATDIWEKAREELKKEIGEQQFTNWLAPIKAISFSDGRITLEVLNEFTSDWIKSHYLERIKDTLKRVSGEEMGVEFSVGEAPAVSSSAPSAPAEGRDFATGEKGRDLAFGGLVTGYYYVIY